MFTQVVPVFNRYLSLKEYAGTRFLLVLITMDLLHY